MSCYMVLNSFFTISRKPTSNDGYYPYRRLAYLCDIFGILQYLNQIVWTNILNKNQSFLPLFIGDI